MPWIITRDLEEALDQVVTIQHLHVVVHASSISCFSWVSLPTITACFHSLIDPFNFFVMVKWSFFRAQCTLFRPELRVPIVF